MKWKDFFYNIEHFFFKTVKWFIIKSARTLYIYLTNKIENDNYICFNNTISLDVNMVDALPPAYKHFKWEFSYYLFLTIFARNLKKICFQFLSEVSATGRKFISWNFNLIWQKIRIFRYHYVFASAALWYNTHSIGF